MLLPSDTIKLGDNYVLNISEALKSTTITAKSLLRWKPKFLIITFNKVKIQSSNQFKTRLFQSLPFALPDYSRVVISFLGKGSPELFGLSLFITICAPTVGIYLGAKQSAKILSLLQVDQSIQNRLCLPQMRNVFR